MKFTKQLYVLEFYILFVYIIIGSTITVLFRNSLLYYLVIFIYILMIIVLIMVLIDLDSLASEGEINDGKSKDF